MEILETAEAGDWLVARAGSFATVGGVAGTGFEAYARILHPVLATRYDPPHELPTVPPPARWDLAPKELVDAERFTVVSRYAADHESIGRFGAIANAAADDAAVDESAVDDPAGVADSWDENRQVVDDGTWPWAEVARRNGRTMHPQVQWIALTDDDSDDCTCFRDGWVVSRPDEGDLDSEALLAAVEHLARHTAAPNGLTAAVWDGFGDFPRAGEHGFSGAMQARLWALRKIGRDSPVRRAELHALMDYAAAVGGIAGQLAVAVAAAPKMTWPDRDYCLVSVTVDELSEPARPLVDEPGAYELPAWCAATGGHTPQLLWPADHSWVLATEIDWDSTIIAGSRALLDEILADRRLEAYLVTPDMDLTWASDTLNPNPAQRDA